ncbi:MAG: hypothetical protein HY287_18040 [Planctomycetes bacterium]|nr:hypothetical protein [Planctomycetota bacterium]MBI3836225.1 hypothetical protein [Planctomycetota bacterium]
MRSLVGLGLLALLLMSCRPPQSNQAPPPDQEPQTIAPDATKPIDFTSLRKSLELTVRARDQEQKSKISGGSQTWKERIYREGVRVETEGYVYHPNFMEFTLSGLFGLLQSDFLSKFDDRERTSSDTGTIYEYDFEGSFLKKKEYPGSVYLKRYSSIEPRPFLSSLQTTTDSEGFAWQYVDPKMPTSLQFDMTDVKLDPLDKSESPGEQKNSSFRFDTSYHFTEHNVLSLTFDRRSVSEDPFALQYDTNDLTLGHRFDFGERHEHRLDSELEFYDQTGTFDTKRNRWRETLRLTHSDTLRSWYQFEAMDRTQGHLAGVAPITEKSILGSGTVEHTLYDSLVSQLFGYAQRQKFDDGLKIERFGVQPSFDYRKKNPWGMLMAGYQFRAQREERTGADLSFEVNDEPATFNDPDPVVLSNTNVVVSSVFITSQDRLIMYNATSDYRVRRVGDRIEIERVPTGRIADGQTVLIDYFWALAGNLTLDTLTNNFSIRENFDFGLQPYYRLRKQDQTLTPADATGVQPDDIKDNTYGVEFRRDLIHFLAEYEDHESTIQPYKAKRLAADLTKRFNRNRTVRLRARWVDIERTDLLGRETKFFTVEGRYREQIGEHLTLEGAALYRKENDNTAGNNKGLDLDFSLEWLIRETELRLTYNFGRFEDDFAENRNQMLYLQFRRRF